MIDETMQRIGERIRTARMAIRPRLSQDGFGALMGVKRTTVWRWEKGEGFDWRQLEKIERVLSLPAGELTSLLSHHSLNELTPPSLPSIAVADDEDALLATAIALVRRTAEREGKTLTRAQLVSAAIKLYSETQKFSEPPTQTAALSIIELIEREADDGAGLEDRTPEGG